MVTFSSKRESHADARASAEVCHATGRLHEEEPVRAGAFSLVHEDQLSQPSGRIQLHTTGFTS
jgi:hypothetical protein